MNEAKKRDFVAQMISLVEAGQAVLMEKGFDPTVRLDELKSKKDAADAAETEQQEAAAKAKEATARANLTLEDAYKGASDFADLISGLAGQRQRAGEEDAEVQKLTFPFRPPHAEAFSPWG